MLQLEASRSPSPGSPTQQWDGLLLRFRKLREGLTAVQAPAELRCEVYECSADVCAAAGNMAELLKCLQQLVNTIHPTLAPSRGHQQQQHQRHHQQVLPHIQQPATTVEQLQQQTATLSLQHDGSSCCSSNGGTPPQRRAEVAAALLLYFVCIPQQPVMHEVVKQLRAAATMRIPVPPPQHSALDHDFQQLPQEQPTPQQQPPQEQPSQQQQPPLQGVDAGLTQPMRHQQQTQTHVLLLLQDPVYQQAVGATAAALSCNFCSFLRTYFGRPAPPPLVKGVMRQHVQRLRLMALQRLAVAYRMLPSATLLRWLWLHHDDSKGSSSSSHASAAAAALGPGAGGRRAPDASVAAYEQVVRLLQQAAADGASRGAAVALAQCTNEGLLPDTLQFRSSKAS